MARLEDGGLGESRLFCSLHIPLDPGMTDCSSGLWDVQISKFPVSGCAARKSQLSVLQTYRGGVHFVKKPGKRSLSQTEVQLAEDR